MPAKFLYIRIIGTGVDLQWKALTHRVVANPASTYHVFDMPDGTEYWYNDFGVRTVTVADSPEKLVF
jgi:hypothetical protein